MFVQGTHYTRHFQEGKKVGINQSIILESLGQKNFNELEFKIRLVVSLSWKTKPCLQSRSHRVQYWNTWLISPTEAWKALKPASLNKWKLLVLNFLTTLFAAVWSSFEIWYKTQTSDFYTKILLKGTSKTSYCLK
jgi:hypothetical protein